MVLLQKARLALAEKGVSYKKTYIDLFNGQSLQPFFMKLNPASTVCYHFCRHELDMAGMGCMQAQ